VLTGIAQGQIRTLGHYQTTVAIDDLKFPLTFHVIPSKALNVAIILGTDFINQAKVIIDQTGITINKPNVPVFLSQIKLQPQNDGVSCMNLIFEGRSRDTVEGMVLAYKPNKIKTTDIELSIVLKDDMSIYQSPRRLPPKEKEIVEKQVND